MNKQMRKRKKGNRLLKLLFALILIVFLSIYIHSNLIFKPFISFQGEEKNRNAFKEWIDQNYPYPFVTKKTVEKIQLDRVNKSFSSINLKRNFFLVWTLKINTKVNSIYILLNNEIRLLDDNFCILDTSLNQEEVKKQIPFLLKIEVLENVPQKSNSKKGTETDGILFPEKTDSLVTQMDVTSIYQKEISKFVEYLYISESSLGPKIALIQFFPKEGLRFILFNNIYWIGYNKNYPQIEKNLTVCESYLKIKNKKQSYNEFDLRYQNQIICRNSQ